MKRSIFVSHSHEDNIWCSRFVSCLRSLGFDVWYDINDLSAMSIWIKKLEQEIASREIFLLVVSDQSLASTWVTEEYSLALVLRKEILPVLYKQANIEGFMRLRQNVDVIGMDAEEAAKKVAQQIEKTQSNNTAFVFPKSSNVEDNPSLLDEPRPEELLEAAQRYWAAEGASIEDAIKAELVPSILKKKVSPNPKDKLNSVTRMHIAKHIGDVMSKESISFEEMVERLKQDAYWQGLCKFIEYSDSKSLPHIQWVKTQAPLYAGGKILYSWSGNKGRYPLIPVLAKAVSLGVVYNGTATYHLTFMSQPRQFDAFNFYCYNSDATDKDLRAKFPKGF